MAIDVVDAADVRVCHLPREVHFALEQLDRAFVGGDGGQDGLQRDVLAQLQILRLIEFAHAAPRQVADDAKARGEDITGPKCRFRKVRVVVRLAVSRMSWDVDGNSSASWRRSSPNGQVDRTRSITSSRTRAAR